MKFLFKSILLTILAFILFGLFPLFAQTNKLLISERPLFQPNFLQSKQSDRDKDFYRILKNNTSIELLDSAICRTEDGSMKELFTYDTYLQMVTHVKQEWQDNIWKNVWRESMTYNDRGDLLETLEETWDDGQSGWANSWRYTYTYNDAGDCLSALSEQWQSNFASWVNYRQQTFTYDDYGNCLTELNQYWQQTTWVNDVRYSYSYDEHGNQLSSVEEKWDTDQFIWVNQERITFTYNENDNETSLLQERWDKSTYNWTPVWRANFDYDENQQWIGSLYQSWNETTFAWVNDTRESRTYDAAGNWLGSLWEKWDAENNVWQNSSQISYTYDDHNNMLTGLSQKWDAGTYSWLNSSRFEFAYDQFDNPVYYYHQKWQESQWEESDGFCVFSSNDHFYWFQGIEIHLHYSSVTELPDKEKQLPLTFQLEQNYPNPFNSTTLINYVLSKSTPVELVIYNVQGQRIRTLVNKVQSAGRYKISWDGCDALGKDVSSGVYFYHLQAGEKQLTHKMLLVR